MKTLNITRILLSLLLASLLTACASAPPPETTTALDPSQIPYEFAEDRRDIELPGQVKGFRVRNPHGGIQVRRTGASTIGMIASIQLLGARPERPTIESRVEGDAVVLTVSYPSDARDGEDARVDGHLKGRVDLGLYVPAGLRVEFETTYGDIYVRRIPNDVTVRSREGRILVGAEGAIVARSDSGRIGAFPVGPRQDQRIDLHSRQGRVALQVALWNGVGVEAVAGEGVDSEIALDRLERGSDGRWHGSLESRSESLVTHRVVSEESTVTLTEIAPPVIDP